MTPVVLEAIRKVRAIQNKRFSNPPRTVRKRRAEGAAPANGTMLYSFCSQVQQRFPHRVPALRRAPASAEKCAASSAEAAPHPHFPGNCVAFQRFAAQGLPFSRIVEMIWMLWAPDTDRPSHPHAPNQWYICHIMTHVQFRAGRVIRHWFRETR